MDPATKKFKSESEKKISALSNDEIEDIDSSDDELLLNPEPAKSKSPHSSDQREGSPTKVTFSVNHNQSSSPSKDLYVNRNNNINNNNLIKNNNNNNNLTKPSVPIWKWQNDKEWKPYPNDVSQKIEAAKRAGQTTIKLDEERFIDLVKMCQRRFDNPNRIRAVQRDSPPTGLTPSKSTAHVVPSKSTAHVVQPISKTPKQTGHEKSSVQQTKVPSASPMKRAASSFVTTPAKDSPKTGQKFWQTKLSFERQVTPKQTARGTIQWAWKSDTEWISYSPELTEKLETAHQRKNSKVKVDSERFVDLKEMYQARLSDPKRRRAVRRRELANWFWDDPNESGWHQFSPQESMQIEVGYRNKASQTTIELDEKRKIDFDLMALQQGDQSSYIKREGPPVKINPRTELKKLSRKLSNPSNLIANTKPQQGGQPKPPHGAIKLDAPSSANPPSKNLNQLQEGEGSDTEEELAWSSGAALGADLIEMSDSDTEEEQDEPQLQPIPLEERRKLYACGKNYYTMDDVPPLTEMYNKLPAPRSPLFKPNPKINSKVSLWRGDITTLEIAAITNAAKPSLLGGGGIDGAIHYAAGPGLVRECRTLGGCAVGDAKLSSGHRLPASTVIHTVGPIGENPAKLTSCYNATLSLCVKYKLREVALCGISTGIYGYPPRKAAQIALSTVRKFLETNADAFDRVVFVVFLDHEDKTYKELICEYFPEK